MTPSNCCATSGELRQVVEDVAQKAAERAVEAVYWRLKADLIESEKRLTRELTDRVDSRLRDALGMSPQDHIIQHDRMQEAGRLIESVKEAFWKRIVTALIIAALAFLGGYSTDAKSILHKPKADQTALVRDDYRRPSTGVIDDETDP